MSHYLPAKYRRKPKSWLSFYHERLSHQFFKFKKMNKVIENIDILAFPEDEKSAVILAEILECQVELEKSTH